MIIEMTRNDFALLQEGKAPGGLRLERDVELAPPMVLDMLAGLAAQLAEQFAPSAWMLVEEGEIVGIMSVTRLLDPGELHIGYGVAPARQQRGFATQAVAALLGWARCDGRVRSLSAETGADNVASQRVLERNGFVRVDDRIDPEDGPVICWRIEVA
ncbi:MAG: GNAT family N-acetyltransferase [Devosia sp.]|nr:GNAT family N-acetyltransferase [Devosia sp.]